MAAKNYSEILALVNAGNQMGLSNTIKRDYGIPLDFTSVQPSYNDAVIYAAENTKAYVGQPLSVGGKLYIINDVAAENKYTIDGKAYDNYLVEVGSATEGDGATIDLENGVLTLHGFEGALSGYLPRKAEDGTLEWVPVSAVVQGDGNKVTTLVSGDESVTITKKVDTDDSLVYDLTVNIPTVPEYTLVQEERAQGATSTTYHLVEDGTNIGNAIVVPDAYDDTNINNRLDNMYTKEEVEGKIDLAVSTILGEGIDEAYNTLKEIQDILEGTDGEAIDGLIESVEANKQAIETLNGTGEGSVAKKIEDAIAPVRELADAAQTAEEVSAAISIAFDEANLDQYATKAEIPAIQVANGVNLRGATVHFKQTGWVDGVGYEVIFKADDFEIYSEEDVYHVVKDGVDETHNTGGFNEFTYTFPSNKNYFVTDFRTDVVATEVTISTLKVGVAAKAIGDEDGNSIKATYATKAELAPIATTANNASTAVANLETRFDEIVAVGGEPNAINKIQVNGEELAITNKTVNILVPTQLSDLSDGSKALSDISTILGRVGTLETAKGDHETRLGVAEGQIASLIAEDKTINETLGTIAGDLVALQGEDARIAGLVESNLALINKKANATDVYTIAQIDGKIGEINGELANKLEANALTPYAKTEDVAKTYATIEALNGVSGNLAAEIERAKAAEEKIAGDLALLIENPTEALDSVKELITHVTAHGTAVEGIITRLDGHDTAIGGINDRLAILEAKPDYELPAATTSILGGVKLSAEVGVNTDGQLEVKTLSTDKLVQGENELVLNGGTATGAASKQ